MYVEMCSQTGKMQKQKANCGVAGGSYVEMLVIIVLIPENGMT